MSVPPLTSFTDEIVVPLVLAAVGGVSWLIRLIFTNNKKIELLEQNITKVEESRKEDRDSLKSDVNDIKADIKGMSTTVTAFIAAQSEVNKQHAE